MTARKKLEAGEQVPDQEQRQPGYIGVRASTWKEKYAKDTTNRSTRPPTKLRPSLLSTHIWDLNARGSTPTVACKVIKRGTPSPPSTISTCWAQKKRSSSSEKTMIVSLCRHVAISFLFKVDWVVVSCHLTWSQLHCLRGLRLLMVEASSREK